MLVDSTAVVERHWREWGRAHGIDQGQLLEEIHGKRTTDVIGSVAPGAARSAVGNRSRWSRAVATVRLRATGLPRVLVSADDVTYGKPHPEGYLLASRQLGVSPSDCMVVEDASAGVAGRRSPGCV